MASMRESVRHVLVGLFFTVLTSQGLSSEEFDTAAREEERTAIGKIVVTFGGMCKVGDWGYVEEVNLSYRYSTFGAKNTNSLATDEACEFLPAFTKLKKLTLSRSQVSDEGLEYIGRLHNLEVLEILDNKFLAGVSPPTYSDDGIRHLTGLKQLEILATPNAGLSDESLDTIVGLQKLRELHVKGNQFTDAGIRKLGKLKHLERLSLGSSRVSSVGLSALTALPIRSLGLIDCGIDDLAMQEIGKFSQLETLWLWRSSVTDDGVEHLINLPLKNLGLDNSRIGDRSIELLTDVKTLEKLLVSETSVSAKSVEHLSKLPNLHHLALPQGFHDDDISRLYGAKPNLFITGSWTAITRENLLTIGNGLESMRKEYGAFPATAEVDVVGEPMLSWRVSILPFIGQLELFNRFHLDEPWNSDHNVALIEEMPDLFAHPSKHRRTKPGFTVYQAAVGDNTVLKVTENQIMDGPIERLPPKALIVETVASKAVPWTAPQDYELEDGSLKDSLLGNHGLTFFYRANGEVGFLRDANTEEDFQKIFSADQAD